MDKRTEFPNIAPSNKKSQLVSRYSFAAKPVFGVDILVRPPVSFSDIEGDDNNRNLQLGDECIAAVIHGNFDDANALSLDEDYSVRFVVGDDLSIPNVSA